MTTSEKHKPVKKSKSDENQKIKHWSFSDHTYVQDINVELLATSNLKEREFVGATTKKGKAHGPVQAGTTSSNIGSITGYGNSSYGSIAYGEAISDIHGFIKEFPPSYHDELVPVLLEGYNILFNFRFV